MYVYVYGYVILTICSISIEIYRSPPSSCASTPLWRTRTRRDRSLAGLGEGMRGLPPDR